MGALEPNRIGNVVAPIERSTIPLGEISRGGVCVLEKLKNRIGRISGSSRIGVIENELAHLRVEAALAFEHRVLKAVGRGRCVGIKCGAAISAVARPETCADHLMRIGLRLDRIHPWPRRRSLAVKPGDGQVERAPEEMDRADLAIEIG